MTTKRLTIDALAMRVRSFRTASGQATDPVNHWKGVEGYGDVRRTTFLCTCFLGPGEGAIENRRS